MDSISKKVSYSYEGRSEMVNKNNETIGLRLKLNSYGIGCCPEVGGSDPNPIGSISVELEVGDDKGAIKFFQSFGEFEVTIKGVKPKKE